MKKLVSAGIFISVILFSGCSIGEKEGDENETLTTVGDDRGGSIPSECAQLLTESSQRREGFNGSYIIARSYKYKSSCINLEIGGYGNMQRLNMNGSPVAGGMFYQADAGSFDAAVSFMESKGISCKEHDGKLLLTFPVGSRGHEDYNEIELNCADSDTLYISVGLDEENGNKLAVTTESRKDNEDSIFHAFDTDSDGVIKKHVKVIDYGGAKEVLLENYKAQ